ncbi:NIPSNAP family protein [Pareuzebyella sediminis]|uniref:NIPSNAP family protein n=1 Tax=Pareuzebyella sediminis TaxID=2607998 RepID=UPI0011EF4AFA|nr:NIPSNAP family protein [Pareuzebyella sediminis]
MKKSITKDLFLFFLTFAVVITAFAQEQNREFYQLKTYTLKNEKQETRMDSFLKEAYLPALKRAGIENVGVFKYRPNNFLIANKIFVLIPFQSLEQFATLEDALAQDKSYLSSGKSYIEASYDDPPYERINSTLMRAFVDMPKMKPSPLSGPRKDRVYELRSYESSTEALYKNKVDMFNTGGEVELFEAIDANAVFYAEVISGDSMPNLMYMTTYPNMEKRDEIWETFFTSDKWKELKSDTHYQNNVSKADILLLYPTEYSDY